MQAETMPKVSPQMENLQPDAPLETFQFFFHNRVLFLGI